ncbi:MAG: GDSL-type esterase/lipase family protein [Dysgonomonas sp.]
MKKLYSQKILIILSLFTLLIGHINAQTTDKHRIWAKDANVLYDYYYWGTANKIQVMNSGTNFNIPSENSVTQGVNYAWNNCFLKFENVDFGTLTDSLTFVRNVPRGAIIEFWIDRDESIRYDSFFNAGSHPDESSPRNVTELSGGKFLGSYQHWYAEDADWSRWETHKIAINPIGGKHNLYVLFRIGGKSGTTKTVGGLYYIDLHRTLKNEITSLSSNETNLQIPIGTYNLQYTFEPTAASTKSLVWSVVSESASQVLTVDNGVVLAMKPGTATVKCVSSRATEDVSLTYNITVTGTPVARSLRIQAEDADTIYNTYQNSTGQAFAKADFQSKGVGNDGNKGLVYTWNTNFAVYKNIDFGTYTNLIKFYHAEIRGGAVEFWVDRNIVDEHHPNRTLTGDYNNPSQKELAGGIFLGRYEFLQGNDFLGNDKWKEFECPIVPISGKHDLYVVFQRGGKATYNSTTGHYDWFELTNEAPKIKVACVGNSITENSALPDNQKYPSILQTFLGDEYQVRNYGLGGRTLLKKGNMPYWNESKYTEVKGWNPDIVVIKLGTNDSKASNWQYKSDFVNDYVEFINSFKNLSSHPTVYICKPLPAYPNTMNIDGTVIHDEILQMIEQIAQLTGVQIIDLYTPLEGKQSYLYDNVHPNVKGTTIMAHYVCKAINPLHEIPSDLYSQVNSFDWTDLAVAITSSNPSITDYSTLTDNDLSTSFEGGAFTANSWIQAELPESFKITGYALSSDSVPADAPKKWKLQGSVNGTDWTDIESRENIQYLHKQETNLFEVTLPSNKETIPAYKYIRITFLENNGGDDLRLSEWQIFGFPAQLVTNITGNGGIITGQYAGYQENGYVETVNKLINNAIGEKYCVVGQNSGWIEYRSSTKVKLSGYSLTRCGALYERDPKSWTLQAYDTDSSAWVTLDTQVNQDFMAQFNTMKYKVNTNKSYLRFRLNITAIQGTSTFQFAKWQLFGEETSAPITVTKVACIGNSITANARVDKIDPSNRYPSILQRLLGDEYIVENYGVGGATMLKGSSYPYWDQPAYANALAFVPDIIVIKLGTNDSNPSNWVKKNNFIGDYVAFINSFKAVNPNVKVFTCYPITSWPSTMPIVDKTVTDEIIPKIDTIAAQTGATVIDLHTPTEGKVYQTYDYVHPDVRGTTLMANTNYKAIEPNAADPYMNPAYISNLTSFDRTDYVVSSSSSTGASVANLFDNNLNTEVDFGTFSSDMYFQFDLPENFRVTGYSITTAQGDITNTPKSWILQGSADKNSWNTIETRTNQRFYYPTETSLYQIDIVDNKTANAENLPAYKYFRVVFKENNGGTNLKLSEFQLYGMNKVMVTSITGNGGSIAGQYPGYQNGTEYVETVDKLIDNYISSKYCVTGHTGGWIQYESAIPVKLSAYSITGSMNDIGRNPKAWELSGSDDELNWELIDKQENQESVFFVRLNTVEYPVSTAKMYQYFKLNILENNGSSEFQLSKWQLFENTLNSIKKPSTDESVKISSENGMIKLTCSGKTKYDIYNLMGILVAKGQCESGTHNIPVASQGLYIVKANSHSVKISVTR